MWSEKIQTTWLRSQCIGTRVIIGRRMTFGLYCTRTFREVEYKSTVVMQVQHYSASIKTIIQNLPLLFTFLSYKNCREKLRSYSLPEVGDWDDDEQVKSHSEQRDGGQHDVNEQCSRPRRCRLPAGGVEELWKAELCSVLNLHLQRAAALAALAAFWTNWVI